MAERLRRMLASGKLTDEECLCMLRALDSRRKKAIHEEEEAEIVIDYRKPLQELLDIRKLSDEQKYPIFCHLDEQWVGEEEEGVEEYMNYHCQIEDNQGFDFDFDPGVTIPRLEGISPFYFGANEEQPPTEMVLYARLGVHWFNFQENRNLKFIRIPKLNTEHPFSFSYYITVQVQDADAADSSPSRDLTFQTMVRRPAFPKLELFIECCRIKPTTAERDAEFNFFRLCLVDEFYKGCMPTFLSEPPQDADDAGRFYEVQKKDIDQNHWLRLYTEFALFQVCVAGSHSFLPDEMETKKILVETSVTHTDPVLKLKSMNAIFHISFRANSCDYTSVVRRTTDWISGHMFFEVDSRKETGDCFS